MDKDYLILKRATVSRPSGQWHDDDYDVLADGVGVGRIMEAAAPAEPPARPCIRSSSPSGRAAHRSSSPALDPLAPGVALRCAHRPAPPARSRTPSPGRTEWSRTSPP